MRNTSAIHSFGARTRHTPARASRTLLLLLVSIGVSSAACNDEKPIASAMAPVRACAVDTECLAQELCIFRLCSAVCFADTNCMPGAACLETGRGAACVRLQDNACLADTDCPEGTLCELGRCLARCADAPGAECLSGRTCVDGVCQEPTAAGAAGAAGAAAGDAGSNDAIAVADAGAASGSTADSGSEVLDCTPGSVRCDEHVVTRCDDTGQEVPEQNCPFACKDGACTGECTPKEMRCEDSVRQECGADGEWQELETCPVLCTPEACESECDEGTRSCNDKALIVCSNGQLTEETVCEYICRDGACTGECAPGDKLCQNDSVVTCNGEGGWGAAVSCPNACIDGSCQGVCVPGSQRCGGAAGFQLCSDEGRWGQTTPCENKACVQGTCTGECSPGATECASDGVPRRCGPEGQWTRSTPCDNGTCVEGTCTGECARDDRRCKPGGDPQVQTCDAQGRWQDGQRCDNGVCLEAECRACKPMDVRCDPGNAERYQECSDEGEWRDARNCPGGGMCSDGECGDPPETVESEGCEKGESPDWFSQGDARDTTLGDPRWGGNLAQALGNEAGFTIVFDRALNALLVTVRATEAAQDEAAADDSVFFGIGAASGESARSVRIPLIDARNGEDPRRLSGIPGSTWSNQRWSNGDSGWVQEPYAWVDSPGVSWAVSFKVDLQAAGVDSMQAFRIALGVNIAGDLTGPYSVSIPWAPDIEMLASAPPSSNWPMTNVMSIECVGRLANF